MKRRNPHALEALVLTIIAAAFICVICIDFAKAQALPPPDMYFAPLPGCNRPNNDEREFVACVTQDLQAQAPDGTRYVLPQGTRFMYANAVINPWNKTTLIPDAAIFSGGFE